MNATPVNFKIPDDYERLFMLLIGDFKYVILANKDGVHTGQIGETPKGSNSAVLDFIAESISQVRYECEKLEEN